MLWIKALHIIAVITWFAALFYLPRLFVYHAMAADQISRDRFVVMERKLYRGIMTPSALFAVLFGIGLLVGGGWAAWGQQGWLHLKLALVGVLLAYHGYCGHLLRDFRDGKNRHGHVFYRWFNEFPVLLLLLIVLLVVVKPF